MVFGDARFLENHFANFFTSPLGRLTVLRLQQRAFCWHYKNAQIVLHMHCIVNSQSIIDTLSFRIATVVVVIIMIIIAVVIATVRAAEGWWCIFAQQQQLNMKALFRILQTCVATWHFFLRNLHYSLLNFKWYHTQTLTHMHTHPGIGSTAAAVLHLIRNSL